MPGKPLLPFQETAVQSGVALFAHAKSQLDQVGDNAADQKLIVAHNGYLLIEAPTGAGKTLMAGTLLEQFSGAENVVWFWFAPFKGVVGQTVNTLRGEFPGLRLRDLQEDRAPQATRRGDVFVTTWQAVAARSRDSRNVRREGEENPSIDQLVAVVRAAGLRIGVVVDEAHHGFHGETQAAKFFREVLQPEYTVLITATPDDAEIEDFKVRLGIPELHRICVSRQDAVRSGLIKSGVKCVAYIVDEAQRALVDLDGTALRDGIRAHQQIKKELAAAGTTLTPLLLVQARDQAGVAKLKERIAQMGFREEQIRTHTSEEPDGELLAIANDESVEVLVFVMAVALGFDAPRAFTLISMRASRDVDFGVQLVGRILRVHRRLHRRARADNLPEALKYGYVFLSAPETQEGLDLAGQRINQIQTEYAKISPATVVVKIAGAAVARTSEDDGQFRLFPASVDDATKTQTTYAEVPVAGELGWVSAEQEFDLPGFFSTTSSPEGGVGSRTVTTTRRTEQQTRWRYALRRGMPRRFKTMEVGSSAASERGCADRFILEARVILDAMKTRVNVQKRTIEVFTREIQTELNFMADLSPDQAARQAQEILCRNKSFDPRELRLALLIRLEEFMRMEAMEEADNPSKVRHFLNIILVAHPQLLLDAQKAALFDTAELIESGELPEQFNSDAPLPSSALNVYGIMPPDLNGWEVQFAKLLDASEPENILWWHRNLPHKEWSVNVLLPDGRGFYPDFVIGVQGRDTEDGILLADPKFMFSMPGEIQKIGANHPAYGQVLIVARDGSARWMVIRYDSSSRKPAPVREFRVSDARAY